MKPLLSLVVGTALLASAVQTQDLVTYRDPTQKTATIHGLVQDENSSHVQVRPNIGPVKDIPSVDIIDIFYELRGQAKLDYRRADSAEKAANRAVKSGDCMKHTAEALGEYTKLLPQVQDTMLG